MREIKIFHKGDHFATGGGFAEAAKITKQSTKTVQMSFRNNAPTRLGYTFVCENYVHRESKIRANYAGAGIEIPKNKGQIIGIRRNACMVMDSPEKSLMFDGK